MKMIEKFPRHQWLTFAILAIQEADIRKITVQSQPGNYFPGLTLKLSI
jgi:hypothetical protein